MDASFYARLDAGMSKLADKMFGDATLTTVTKAFDPRTDTTTETTVTRTVQAIRATETITDVNGATKTVTAAYLRERPSVGDRLTMGATTNEIREVDNIDPAGIALMFKAVLS